MYMCGVERTRTSSIRLSLSEWEALRAAAAADERLPGTKVRLILREWLRERGYLPARAVDKPVKDGDG